MRARLLLPLVLLVAIVAAPAPAPASAAPGPGADRYAAAQQQERQGEFAAALATLRGPGGGLTARQAAHRTALRHAVGAFAATDVYLHAHQLRPARAVLTTLGTQLDPIRDLYLRSAQEGRLSAVEAAQAPKHHDDKAFFPALGNDLATAAEGAAKWILILAAVALVLALLYGLRRGTFALLGPRRGIGVSVHDASASADEKADGDRALAREVLLGIGTAGAGAAGALRPEIDVAKDVDGGVSLNVRVAGDELEGLEQYLGGDTIKMGPIAVSPRQLVAFLRGLVARPYENELRGSLAVTDAGARFTAELRRDGHPTITWSSTADGADGRARVLAELAERVVFEVGGSETSQVWASVCCCRQAMSELRAIDLRSDDRENELDAVRRLLERSLMFDPTNLLARFQLGTVLRKLGLNEDAIDQYDFIETLARETTRPVPPTVRRAAVYSRAVARSKLRDAHAHTAALRAFEDLCTELAQDNTLDAAQRAQLTAVVESAWAATKVYELEALRYAPDDDPDVQEQRDAAARKIDELYGSVRSTPAEMTSDWPGYVQALAVAENAAGRAMHLLRRPADDVVLAFTRALALIPELGDAQVNLASALFRTGAEAGRDDRIERHLARALELSPRDCRALSLRGRLELARRHRAEARTWYEQAVALGDAWAAYYVAEIDWADGQQLVALDGVCRSLALDPGHDHRERTLVQWASVCLGGKGDQVRAEVRGAARHAAEAVLAEARERGRDVPACLDDPTSIVMMLTNPVLSPAVRSTAT